MTRGCLLLHDLLADTAMTRPNAVALVSQGKRYTYREIDDRADSLAHTLVDRGISRGDRVLVFGESSVETAIAFWAVLKANAVVSIVHPQTKPDKLAYLLADIGAKALITQASLEGVFVPAAARAQDLELVIVTGLTPAVQTRLTHLRGVVGWEAAVANRVSSPPVRRCIDADLASIVYTSGSTGTPKGVMFTHRNMVAACASISDYLEIQSDDVILCVLPLAFGYGLYQMIMAFAAGARVVLERSFAFPAQVMQTVVDEGVTGFPGVPTMFATLLGASIKYDLSKIRYLTNAAAALPVKHIAELRALFPNAKLYSMYGLTECTRCSYLPPADLDRKPDSVGIAIPNTELWLVDETGQRVGAGQVGELVIRGATVMKGYWRNPDATAKKLRRDPVTGDRVLHTGDLCRRDEDGYLYFIGRMDEVIKSRGEKVPPKEVETTLLGIPGVSEAAVIGVPDDMLGAAIKAFVVLEPGARLDARAIQRECRARLESFMVPTYVELRPTLPKSPNGKIQKSELA